MEMEFSGLLFKVLQHLKKLIKQKFIFTREKDINTIREKYDHLSNPIVQFLKERCERTYNSDDFIYKYEFLQKLNDWLKNKKFNTYTNEKVGKAMNELEFEDGKKDSPNKEKRYNAWTGIRWITVKTANNVQPVKDVNVDTNNSLEAIEIVSNYLDKVDNLDNGKCKVCVNADECESIGKTNTMRELCEEYSEC